LRVQPSAIYKPVNWLKPFDWADLFADASRPVEVDIGCGKGGFLLWGAGTHPDSNYLGIERQLVRLRKVDQKIQRAGLSNARLLRCEAGYFVNQLVPAGSITAYHIYFPDPWPKRRHHPRRLIQPAFVGALHRTLRRGGVVHIATDDRDYFTHIENVMRESGLFRQEPAQPWPVEAQTEFEKVFLAAGKSIGRARFYRREQGAE
jgi:tRNA (guanine-N7-)-methyltransferase